MSTEGELVFCKLGGSAITDKARPETPREDVIARLAGEVARSLAARPGLRLLLGHGSGSFGHMVARRYNTHLGVRCDDEWVGFAQVAAAAARLNRIVADALLATGVPTWSLQPSASARCRDGELVSLATEQVEQALVHGLVPLLYGDVAIDSLRGGTIVSTEQLLAFLARRLMPDRLILVSAVDGVYDRDPHSDPGAQPIPVVSARNWARVRTALGSSHATDVTGGMLSKLEVAISLAQELPRLSVHVIAGSRDGALETLLAHPNQATGGTRIQWAEEPPR